MKTFINQHSTKHYTPVKTGPNQLPNGRREPQTSYRTMAKKKKKKTKKTQNKSEKQKQKN
jgi:hypothetical protein